ncbi:MAG: hypothetical protein JNN15_21175, partial [Blastocatellia bacterium]|nr:hypothetical protein [Blastocatellia bacterium]
DLDALVSRAEAAEELNLPAKALEDYESYLKLPVDQASRSLIEKKVTKLQEAINNPIKPKATYYEEFNSFLNSYLLSLIEGKNAQDELKLADSIATLMMKNTGDRVGVDQVEFYSKLSVDAAKELLEARLETEEVSKVVAIDHFQDSIDKLYKIKEVFVKHGANIETQTVTVLLAKFLSKAGRVPDARVEVDQWLKFAKDKSYLFNYAQLLFWDGHVNIYERKEQEAIRKLQECIELCQKLDAEKFVLYPSMVASQVYVVSGENEIALNESIESLTTSLKYKFSTFSSQLLQNAGLASAGLEKPYLAEVFLEEAIKICEKEGLWGYSSVLKANLAAILAHQANTKKAIDLIETAKIDIGKTTDSLAKQQQLMQITSYEGKVQGLARNFVKSENCYRTFLRMSEQFGYKELFGIGQIRKGLGEALLEQGRKSEAFKEFESAREEFRKAQKGLHPKNQNRFLDYSFSGKDIEELIKLVQP